MRKKRERGRSDIGEETEGKEEEEKGKERGLVKKGRKRAEGGKGGQEEREG